METASFLKKDFDEGIAVAYNTRDLITYAIGIGCNDLRYVYEYADEFQAFPTYPVVLAFKGTDSDIVDFPSEVCVIFSFLLGFVAHWLRVVSSHPVWSAAEQFVEVLMHH